MRKHLLLLLAVSWLLSLVFLIVPAQAQQEDQTRWKTLVNYIDSILDDRDQSELVADMFVEASGIAKANYGVEVDPCRMATLARWESRFDVGIISRNGKYYGLLQLCKKYHLPGMKKVGLDFYTERDRLVYGCLLYSWHGDQPWSVRYKARRDYKKWFK